MAFACELSVEGLFGNLSHHICLRREETTTILTGPNGSGKTHLLKILAGIVGLDFESVMTLPFTSAVVTYEGGAWLRMTRQDGGESPIIIEGKTTHSNRVHRDHFNPKILIDAELPDYIQRAGPNMWIDARDGEELTDRELAGRFNVSLNINADQVIAHFPWLAPFRPVASPTLILTGRLETTVTPPQRAIQFHSPYRMSRPTVAVSRIASYTERISGLIGAAKQASLATSQMADRQFASRALDKARATVQESELRSRYRELSTLDQNLHRNGLTEQTIDLAFPPGRMNPTEKRILNLFLEDWEAKLAPLLPVHEKIELWRSVVAAKLANKRIRIDVGGEVTFRSTTGDRIPVELLSSGEQHLVALYTMLLFAATPNSLVIIDEPEISLHAAWKHSFLADIARIAAVNQLQIVLATHSTAIINGRWELVEELALPSGE